MKIPSSNDASPHDELPLPYRIAVQTILAEPVPKLELERLVPSQSTLSLASASRRRWMTQVCGLSVAGAAAVVLAVSFFALRPANAWAQVVNAVRKQPWVRMQASAPDKSLRVEMWLSPTKRIGAGRFPGSAFFVEFDQYKLQRFDEKENTIYISEPRTHDVDHFIDLDSVLESLASGEKLQQSKAESVKLLGQSQKKGNEGDNHWVDYVLDYEDAGRSPPRFRRVFRVPEGAELPTRMAEEWEFDSKTQSRSFELDYPAAGPADLFALDVPKDAKVVDTRSGEELRSFLAAYTKQQKTPFDPFSAMVLGTAQEWKSITDAYKVRLDGTGHKAEVVDGEQLLKLIIEDGVRMPLDADPVQWWKTEVSKLAFHDFGSSDTFHPGQACCPNLVVYPMLGISNEGVRATLNPKPVIGPSDTVMVTIENAKTGSTLRRYWFAADRELICIRSEICPEKTTDWIDTTIVDSAEKSPKGRWYATQVRRGQVEHSGEDLRAEAGVAPVATQVYRYLIEFE